MARDYTPQADPWAVEPNCVKLYRRERAHRSLGISHEERQRWHKLLGRLKDWQKAVSTMDDSPSPGISEREGTSGPTSPLSASATGDPPSPPTQKRRILTEQDYQAWLLTQQTILSCDVLSGMRTSPPSSFRSRR